MTYVIPAVTKTYVVTVEPSSSQGYVKTPVVGWLYEDGDTPTPITIDGIHRLLKGSAVLFSCGMVADPNSMTFESDEEWLESAPQKGSKAAAKPANQQKPDDLDEASEGAYDIEWTDKTYKTNSFWHYCEADYEFVYQVDGGDPVPKATDKNAKITRTEMMELKKSIDLLTVDDIKSADPLPVPEDDDDDDDGEDLI